MLRFKKLLCSETQVSNKHIGKIKSSVDTVIHSYVQFENLPLEKDLNWIPILMNTRRGLTMEPEGKDIDQFINKIICGDCLDILRNVPNDSINTIVTSPPYYSQRDYKNGVGNGIGNEISVEEYINALVSIFKECVRIIKKNGSIFFNIGDKYFKSSLLLVPYRFALEVSKLKSIYLINQITWVKPNPQPRQFKGRLVSSTEPIFHFTKSLKFKYFREKFMSGDNINRNNKNQGKNIGKKYFELIKKSELSDDQKETAYKELKEVINEVKSGNVWSFRMKIKGIHSAAYGGYEGGRKNHIKIKGFTIIRMYDRPMKKDVIEAPILSLKFINHPAVYPETIVQECLNLTTETNDVVLDPFIGSGTTAVVAKRRGRRFIGIDINEDYCKIAEQRVKETIIEPKLFDFIT